MWKNGMYILQEGESIIEAMADYTKQQKANAKIEAELLKVAVAFVPVVSNKVAIIKAIYELLKDNKKYSTFGTSYLRPAKDIVDKAVEIVG